MHHDGDSLTRFGDATGAPAVEHRHIEAAFEARTRESVAYCKRSGISSSSGKDFDWLEAMVEARRQPAVGR